MQSPDIENIPYKPIIHQEPHETIPMKKSHRFWSAGDPGDFEKKAEGSCHQQSSPRGP